MKKALCICFAFLGFAHSSSFASDYETEVLGRIRAEEEQAKAACARMKQDKFWVTVAEKLKQRTDIFYKLSPKDKALLLRNSSAISEIYEGEHFSVSLFPTSRRVFDSEVDNSRSLFNKAMIKTRPLRVLRECKSDLITKVPLHADNERRYSEYINEDIKFLETFDRNMKAALDTLSKEVLSSPTALDESLFKQRVLVEHQSTFLNFVYFPYHLLVSNGNEKLFKREKINYDELLNDIDKDIDRIKLALGKTLAREQRVSKVKSGDISAAESCSEIAFGLIPKDRLSGTYNLVVSNDFQEVLVKPTNEIYAGIGKIVDSSDSAITLVQTEILANKQYVFQLKHDGKTRWFGDRIAHGSYVSFVGRYVNNATTTLQVGRDTVRLPLRVYDAICISSK